MKRLLLVAISVLLVMSLAACGCSGNVSTEPTNTPTTEPTTAPTTAPTTIPPTDGLTDPTGDLSLLPDGNVTGRGMR